MAEILRHKKTGGLYEVLFRGAQIQTGVPLADYDLVTIYQQTDGSVVVQPIAAPARVDWIPVYDARIQTGAPLTEGAEVVVYRSLKDAKVWARRTSEMDDGRFEAVVEVRERGEQGASAVADRALAESEAAVASSSLRDGDPSRITLEGVENLLWELSQDRDTEPGDMTIFRDAWSRLQEYRPEARRIIFATHGHWSAWSEEELDSDPSDPLVGRTIEWFVGFWRAGEPDADTYVRTGFGRSAERIAKELAVDLNEMINLVARASDEQPKAEDPKGLSPQGDSAVDEVGAPGSLDQASREGPISQPSPVDGANSGGEVADRGDGRAAQRRALSCRLQHRLDTMAQRGMESVGISKRFAAELVQALTDPRDAAEEAAYEELEAVSARVQQGWDADESVFDAARLRWLEQQARKSRSGISFDWVPPVEGERSGFRFMRRFFVTEQCDTLKAAIDRAMLEDPEHPTDRKIDPAAESARLVEALTGSASPRPSYQEKRDA